jgi:hypothetical protein
MAPLRIAAAFKVIRDLARQPESFTPDDVRERLPEGKLIGVAFSALARAGIIRPYGDRLPAKRWIGTAKAMGLDDDVTPNRCDGCQEVFGGIHAFDAHRFHGECLPPVEMERRGLHRKPDGRWGRLPPQNLAKEGRI